MTPTNLQVTPWHLFKDFLLFFSVMISIALIMLWQTWNIRKQKAPSLNFWKVLCSPRFTKRQVLFLSSAAAQYAWMYILFFAATTGQGNSPELFWFYLFTVGGYTYYTKHRSYKNSGARILVLEEEGSFPGEVLAAAMLAWVGFLYLIIAKYHLFYPQFLSATWEVCLGILLGAGLFEIVFLTNGNGENRNKTNGSS